MPTANRAARRRLRVSPSSSNSGPAAAGHSQMLLRTLPVLETLAAALCGRGRRSPSRRIARICAADRPTMNFCACARVEDDVLLRQPFADASRSDRDVDATVRPCAPLERYHLAAPGVVSSACAPASSSMSMLAAVAARRCRPADAQGSRGRPRRLRDTALSARPAARGWSAAHSDCAARRGAQ